MKVSKGQSQPEIVAAAFLILEAWFWDYDHFTIYRVLIVTQMFRPSEFRGFEQEVNDPPGRQSQLLRRVESEPVPKPATGEPQRAGWLESDQCPAACCPSGHDCPPVAEVFRD